MKSIAYEARKKEIPIYYIYGLYLLHYLSHVFPFIFLFPGVSFSLSSTKSSLSPLNLLYLSGMYANPPFITIPSKLRLLVMSELELATKLSSKDVLNNLGQMIKSYEGKIDGIHFQCKLQLY